jgi:tetratricopeptide (TPR) repeat protein
MALRKEPQRRYASVGKFSDDIQRHLEGLPVIARKDALAYRTIKIDSNYALAYSGLAHIQMLGINPLVRVARMEKARAAALKALEIDNTLAEAHMALGRTLIFFDWDWIASEKTFKQAIVLSPNNPDVHYWYSHNLTAQGRHDEALAELRRALEIDPFSSRFATGLGYALYLARRYDEAIEESLKTPFEVDSAYHQVYWRLGLSYAQKGVYSEAFSMLEKALVLSGEMPLAKGSLAYVHAKSGNRAEAYRVLDEISRLPKNEDAPLMMMAGTYACLGDKDKAIERLEKLYEVRDAPLMHIKVDPMLDSIRSDPRYEELLRRIGLTP